ncbi:MAG TPA: SprT family zinc-dependent metalloprotease [Alphaproteobacteria bacterium]|jgi:hypothetical protein|nr:SprT family zinc-dependent metalloprotease [Alphaproteobacteria bacterium]MDP6272022.1 SprT family zinc-dependent metalloprotease [Alphaproteobacteria bacterium]MDP7164165.1 SprT family zinc-dependent metalloprotease [Alphaproteobacteria bacterium]MDP7426771.1 SprT family zinc-dependent metalloprotease [Alphaproteobacteria bacterium]HJM49993.1 SprT family zinc-dependent metalloprotease [Alphaproteobacteria bacterium]
MSRDDPAVITHGGQHYAIRVRPSARARRMALKIDPRRGAELVLPRGISRRRGLAFAAEHGAWLADRLAALPEQVPFAAGATIPYLGRPHVVCHRPETRLGQRPAPVWLEAGNICVSGGLAHLGRRLGDWLKLSARREALDRVEAAAGRIDAGFQRLTIRDPRTRWGSCSAQGGLSFSWRLILAPEAVFDYVVAHEVAHLLELNHGARFWDLVEQLVLDSQSPRDWLSQHGTALHRYG